MADVPGWRLWVLQRLDLTLVLFDLALGVVFFGVAIGTGSPYFRGVAIGLVIAGVTGAVALIYKRKAGVPT